MKNILISGGNGFIGRNLSEQIEGYNIFAPTSRELDFTDTDALVNYLLHVHIDIIIHCATFTKRNIDANAELYVNLRMICNLEKVSHMVNKILIVGSGAEYDKRYPLEFAKEEDFSRSIPENAYGFSKYIGNLIARGSDNIYNLRLFGVYGKYENYLTCFISNLCCKAVFDLPLTIRQNCLFDFIYIDDLIPVFVWFMENTPLHKEYNVTSGNAISLSRLASIVNDITGKKLDIIINKEGLNLPYTADNSRLIQEFPIKITPHDVAIKQLYGWYDFNKSSLDANAIRCSK